MVAVVPLNAPVRVSPALLSGVKPRAVVTLVLVTLIVPLESVRFDPTMTVPCVPPEATGTSAPTRARKVGAPADPFGAANTVLAVWLARVAESVPAAVMGEPDTVRNAGKLRATEVTVPARSSCFEA